MKIAIIGATGWIGSSILKEAISRGHQVRALVRDEHKLSEIAPAYPFDFQQGIAPAVFDDVELVIASIGGRAAQQHQIVPQAARQLLELLPKTQVKRLLWVGGAGSLEVAPGVSLVSSPDFPEEYKAEALAQGEALTVFRRCGVALDWTFVSPAAEIYPGDSEGPYRLGGDLFFTDKQGKSRISVTDYAKAMLDLAEAEGYRQQRVSVAY